MKRRLQPQEVFNLGTQLSPGRDFAPVVLGTHSFEVGADKPVHILAAGQVRSDKGDFLVNKESMQSIPQLFKDKGVDLVIDYEHQTYTGQKAVPLWQILWYI